MVFSSTLLIQIITRSERRNGDRKQAYYLLQCLI